MSKNKRKSIKAEITVVFKTCNLIDSDEFETKYQGDIKRVVHELINTYTLLEILENNYQILEIKKSVK